MTAVNNIQKNKAELYKDAIDALLKKWDSAQSIKRDEIYKKLSLRYKEIMLSRIAATTFEKGQYFLPQRVLEKHIMDFIQNLQGTKKEELEPDSEVILKSIEAQHGLFVERAKRIYSFSHLTFQEYFTAKYIVDNAKKGSLENLVESHLYEDNWREVFLLTAGMLVEADDFLFLMKKKVDSFLVNKENKKLSNFIRNVQSYVVKKNTSYPPPLTSRVLTIYSVLKRYPKPSTFHSERKLAWNLALVLKLERELGSDHGLDFLIKPEQRWVGPMRSILRDVSVDDKFALDFEHDFVEHDPTF